MAFSSIDKSLIAQSGFALVNHARKPARADQPAVTIAFADHRSWLNVISPRHFRGLAQRKFELSWNPPLIEAVGCCDV